MIENKMTQPVNQAQPAVMVKESMSFARGAMAFLRMAKKYTGYNLLKSGVCYLTLSFRSKPASERSGEVVEPQARLTFKEPPVAQESKDTGSDSPAILKESQAEKEPVPTRQETNADYYRTASLSDIKSYKLTMLKGSLADQCRSGSGLDAAVGRKLRGEIEQCRTEEELQTFITRHDDLPESVATSLQNIFDTSDYRLSTEEKELWALVAKLTDAAKEALPSPSYSLFEQDAPECKEFIRLLNLCHSHKEVLDYIRQGDIPADVRPKLNAVYMES